MDLHHSTSPRYLPLFGRVKVSTLLPRLTHLLFSPPSAGEYHFFNDTLGTSVAIFKLDALRRGVSVKAKGGGKSSDCETAYISQVFDLEADTYAIAVGSLKPGVVRMVILHAS